MFVYPYHTYSMGAKALATALGCLRIKRKGSKFRGSPDKAVINWGCSALPDEVRKCRVINHPEAVKLASNKLRFFRKLDGLGLTPEYTTSKEKAIEWTRSGRKVCCRTLVSSKEGKGLVLASAPEEVVEAPLYTLYHRKQHEYRVQVVGDAAVAVRRKARKKSVPDHAVNWQVRSYANGFIFARAGVPEGAERSELERVAVAAVRALGLDFGGVDIMWSTEVNRPLVIEVNTAPGIEGGTVPALASALAMHCNEPLGNLEGIEEALG